MAEENKEVTPPVVEQQPVELSPVEQKALEQGWRPQSEWEGDPDEWRTAKEFLIAGELFKKIDDQNRLIKDLKKGQAEFAKHYEKVRETEYKRAMEELKAKKREALVDGDVDAVIEIDEKIAEAKIEAAQPAPQVDVSEVNPVFATWKDRNRWYENDDVMKAYADMIGIRLAGTMSPTDLLSEVERQVKSKFSDKFQNPKRSAAPAVEGGGARGNVKAKDTFQLSDDERRVMQRFVRQGILTEEQYIADLKKTRGV